MLVCETFSLFASVAENLAQYVLFYEQVNTKQFHLPF